MKTVFLPYPVSANRYWRTFRNMNVLSQEAKEYKRNVANLAVLSGMKPTSNNVRLTVILHPKAKKDGTASLVVLDLDNCLKVTIDALKNVAYYDDKQVKGIMAEYGEPMPNGALSVKVENFS